jgi:hypothetical protein
MESHPTEDKSQRHLQVIYGRDNPWNTAMELDYLRRLGQHRPETIVPRPVRSRLLRNYIAAGQRRNWGNIDGQQALAYARQLLCGGH